MLELLDTRQWYTPEQAAALFGALDRLDSRARAVYARTEVSIDMIFPAAYGLLFALLLLSLFGDRRRFYLLPIAGATADVFENLSITLLASTYDGDPTFLDESGGSLHAAEERADPGDAGRGGRWRDSTAVGDSTTRVSSRRERERLWAQSSDRRPHWVRVPLRTVGGFRPRNPGAPAHGDHTDGETLRTVIAPTRAVPGRGKGWRERKTKGSASCIGCRAPG